jgi:hypothetical protein
MTARARCNQGHEWDAAAAALCPVCQAPAQTQAFPALPAAATIDQPEQEGPPRAAAARPPLLVAGYEVLEELGRGGMGVVYRARHRKLGHEVALKMILAGGHASPEELARFHLEAAAVARLKHPGIVQLHEFGEHDGNPFFSLELLEGGSLDNKLEAGPLPAHAAAALVEKVARATQHAHAAGIIHRDLKPANVLLTAAGEPKITDFGLAKQLNADQGLSYTGAVLGTPLYMAPEQAAGRLREVGPATDVYALGAILYRCLTGQVPFRGATGEETRQMVLHHDPTPPRQLVPALPRDLEAICLRCLEKEPAKRYATAAELADDLGRWQRGEAVRARRYTPLYRLRKLLWRRRRPLAAAAAVLLGLGLVYLGLADADYRVPGGEEVRRFLDRQGTSLFRPIPDEGQIRRKASALRADLAATMLQACPQWPGWWEPSLVRGDEPGYDAWTQGQTLTALLKCPETDAAVRRLLARSLLELFRPPDDRLKPFEPGQGWVLYPTSIRQKPYPSGIPTAWALPALAKALTPPDQLDADTRDRLRSCLEQLEETLDRYRTADLESGQTGGWKMFVEQKEPNRSNIYVTAVVLVGLLDLRQAGLPWRGSRERTDELLRATVRWVVGQFDGRGWRCRGSTSERELNDGLTLFLFGLLLRAEAEAGVALPESLLARVPHHLDDCGTRPAGYPNSVGLFSTPFTYKGKEYDEEERMVRFLWYPWAVQASVWWLARVERVGAPRDEAVRARRILGHLILALGPQVEAEVAAGKTFIAAETLHGLTAVPP